jgi:hypothetical protein
MKAFMKCPCALTTRVFDLSYDLTVPQTYFIVSKFAVCCWMIINKITRLTSFVQPAIANALERKMTAVEIFAEEAEHMITESDIGTYCKMLLVSC